MTKRQKTGQKIIMEKKEIGNQDGVEEESEQEVEVVQQEKIKNTKLNKNFYDRAKAGITMLLSFIFVLLIGQTYNSISLMVMCYIIFKELCSVKDKTFKQINSAATMNISKAIYALSFFVVYSSVFEDKFQRDVMQNPFLNVIIRSKGFITVFFSYCMIVYFVFTLKKQTAKRQIRVFKWTFLSCLILSMIVYCAIENTLEGQIWFAVPVLLVILNDIFAYFVGYFFGKHQLIAISPKKTWEGYIGSSILTLLITVFLSQQFQSVSGMTCPLQSLTFKPFYFDACDDPLLEKFKVGPLQISYLTAHMLFVSLYASLLGPFGGFFASGLKRSLEIKDFSNLIPGHGGIIDRFDCIFFMTISFYFYLHYFLRPSSNGTFQSTWINSLHTDQKLLLLQQLQNELNQTVLQ